MDDKVGKSCFSQWYEVLFKFDGVCYVSVEYYMMVVKVCLFDDFRLFECILVVCSLGEVKVFGCEVVGFDEVCWNVEWVGIVIEGNFGKFGQNVLLKKYFLGIVDWVLVEVSLVDVIWGIGLVVSDFLVVELVIW